ncbi:MAG: amylo-alpha-1,6-glucosidase [Gallionella sp.]
MAVRGCTLPSVWDADKARSFLEPLGKHLSEACFGNVSEIFDADPLFAHRCCFGQAWGASEVLSAWLDVKKSG